VSRKGAFRLAGVGDVTWLDDVNPVGDDAALVSLATTSSLACGTNDIVMGIHPNGYLAGSRNLQLQGLVTPSSHAYHRSDICPGDMGIISRDILSQLILPAARNSKESWI
jgi:hypothetical protein